MEESIINEHKNKLNIEKRIWPWAIALAIAIIGLLVVVYINGSMQQNANERCMDYVADNCFVIGQNCGNINKQIIGGELYGIANISKDTKGTGEGNS